MFWSPKLRVRKRLHSGLHRRRSLRRTNERWSTQNEDQPALQLDESFPEAEQVPRQVDVD